MTTNKESQNRTGANVISTKTAETKNIENSAKNAANAAENNGEQKVVVPFNTQVQIEKKDEQPTPLVPKVLTLQDYKERAVNAFHLQKKHSELTAKRQEVKEFDITSDQQNATITVTDKTGKTITSNSPKSIKKLMEFWTEEFTTAIDEVETEIKGIFGMEQAAMQPQIREAA